MKTQKKWNSIPDVLLRLSNLFGTKLKNRTLQIPNRFGAGYCTGFVFNDHIRMLISNYELNEDIIIENRDIKSQGKMIFFKFQNIISKPIAFNYGNKIKATPSVLIATSRLNTDQVIAIHTNMATINIEVHADYLKEIFASEEPLVLQSLLDNDQPLLFEEIVSPSLQKIADEIITTTLDKGFELFYFRIKAEEMICRLLLEFKKRNDTHLYALNSLDVHTIYKLKNQMLNNLGTPPVIKELAINASMSVSKLKRLFKQIFGTSIFNYYQQFRMQEAARLLKEEKTTVSEVGYQLGFTNLSHFSKVFKQHIGMKPKQYSKSSSE
jgi:AraC-like DNA-binding protein